MTISTDYQGELPLDSIKPGDRVYRWVWCGGNESDVQELTVIRVNRKTVTVDTNQGTRLRIPPADIGGRVDWE